MDEIVDYIGAKIGQTVSTALFLDGGFAETLKWQGRTTADANLLVLSLSALLSGSDDDAIVTSWMKLFKPLRGVFMVSTPLRDALPAIKKHAELFAFSECIVLTTSTPESTILPDQGADLDEPYAFVVDALQPSRATVLYFPLHAVPILSSSSPTPPSSSPLQVFALSSPGCRSLSPVTLGTLKPPDSQREGWSPSSVHEVEASDLPFARRVELRCLAHELSGALVSELALDCADNIYTLGRTSSFVGHSMQPIMATLLQGRKDSVLREMDREQGLIETDSGITGEAFDPVEINHLATRVRGWSADHRSDESYNHNSDTACAALLLIDRTEDLFTPSAHGGAGPLAHRVLSTLSRGMDMRLVSRKDVAAEPYPLCDVEVQSALHANMLEATQSGAWIGQETTCDRPFSAVAALPWDLSPSICSAAATSSPSSISISVEQSRPTSPSLRSLPALHRLLISGAEEDLRVELVTALKSAIAHHGGQLPPPKKRGAGAEILALAQSLLASPGSGSVANAQGPNTRVCMEEQPLLTLCATVIEAMQRSASKASAKKESSPSSSTHGVLVGWQCSFDVRGARERAVEELLQPGLACFAECVPFLVSFLQSPPMLTMPPTAASSGRLEDPCAGPADLPHLLLMATRVLSVFGLQCHLLAPTATSDRFPRPGDASSSPWSLALRRDVGLLVEAVRAYLLTGSPVGELNHLEELGILPRHFVAKLLATRATSSSSPPAGAEAKEDVDEWDDDFDVPTNANQGKAAGREEDVELLLQDIVDSWADRLVEVASGLRSGCLEDGRPTEIIDLLSAVKQGGVVSTPRAPDKVQGLLARTVAALMQQDAQTSFPSFQHVESALQQLKRAGLGLLSSGLSLVGRWGLNLGGNSVAAAPALPTPVGQPTVVIFVLGGLSCREICQVQYQLDTWSSQQVRSRVRVILASNRLVSGEDIVSQVFDCQS